MQTGVGLQTLTIPVYQPSKQSMKLRLIFCQKCRIFSQKARTRTFDQIRFYPVLLKNSRAISFFVK